MGHGFGSERPNMDVFEIFAIIAAIVGLLGSIVPGIPGPPVSWIGILLMYIGGHVGLNLMIWWGVITVIVTLLDYMAPIWSTRITGGHKAASTGAILGLIIGLIVPPVGMILGSLLGAFIGELFVTDKGVWAAFKAGLGAFLGFLLGTGLKLIACGLMAFYIVKAVIVA